MAVNFKMNTYPCNQVRDNILLDEECDLSDVEDEVFIRDGKNNYKLADEINVKQPLMPLRKNKNTTIPKIQRKLKKNYRELLKPCCQFLAALCILISLIVLVIIIVAIFPMPLDRIHHWIVHSFTSINQTTNVSNSTNKLPCSTIKVTNVWTADFPKIRTECPIRTIDVNKDGFEDVLFGFNTGNYSDVLPPNIFCPVFMETEPPCDGGLIALNGKNGEVMWKHWFNNSIYFIECDTNFNNNYCLILGTSGMVAVINAMNGSIVWRRTYENFDIITGGFINDLNEDKISDVLFSKTKRGHSYLVLLSGKNGDLIKQMRLPTNQKSYIMPELVKIQDVFSIIFGTGGITLAGNLSSITLKDFLEYDVKTRTNIVNITNLYQNEYGGILVQPLLVDITGDNKLDIIIALHNSTILALNGENFTQIWNFTVKNSLSNMIPIPAYFNYDNVTDFLIMYKTYDDILKYAYMQTYILNGINGRPIYDKPITHRVVEQIGGLSLQMDVNGFDMFLFWTAECLPINQFRNYSNDDNILIDKCPEDGNHGRMLKMNILSQFDQPPGIEIFNSLNITVVNNTNASVMDKVKEFMRNQTRKSDESYAQQEDDYENFNKRKKYQHEVSIDQINRVNQMDPPLSDYNTNDLLNNYSDDDKKESIFYERNTNQKKNNNLKEIRKQNVSTNWPKHSTEEIYHYPNIKRAKNRLMHDLSNSPDDILSDTYYKTLKSKLRYSRFEQRDINSHINRRRENEDIQKFINKDKELKTNISFNLWNLESEMEKSEVKKNNENIVERDTNDKNNPNVKIFVSMGETLDSLTNGSNSIDVISIIYWQPEYSPFNINGDELSQCVQMKIDKDDSSIERMEEKKYYTEECIKEFQNKQQTKNVEKLNLGNLRVFRLKLECQCKTTKLNEKCPNFSKKEKQKWSTYLGSQNNGVFTSAQN